MLSFTEDVVLYLFFVSITLFSVDSPGTENLVWKCQMHNANFIRISAPFLGHFLKFEEQTLWLLVLIFSLIKY